jgi:hypothetical protein
MHVNQECSVVLIAIKILSNFFFCFLYLIIYFISNSIFISKTEAEENNYEPYIIQKYDTIESILIKKNLRPIYGKNANI